MSRIQIIANTTDGFRFGEKALWVEAVPVKFGEFPFITTCYATPYIDSKTGEPTERWVITESESGQTVGYGYKGKPHRAMQTLSSPTIEKATEKALNWLKRMGFREDTWKAVIDHMKTVKEEKLKIIQVVH